MVFAGAGGACISFCSNASNWSFLTFMISLSFPHNHVSAQHLTGGIANGAIIGVGPEAEWSGASFARDDTPVQFRSGPFRPGGGFGHVVKPSGLIIRQLRSGF
jgi:hypothetical protein